MANMEESFEKCDGENGEASVAGETSTEDALSDLNGERDTANNELAVESPSRMETSENGVIAGCDSPTSNISDETDLKPENVTDVKIDESMIKFTIKKEQLSQIFESAKIIFDCLKLCNHVYVPVYAIVYAIPFVTYAHPFIDGLCEEEARFSTFNNCRTRHNTIRLARIGFYFELGIQCAFCRESVPEDWQGPLEQLHDAQCTFPAGNVPIEQYGSEIDLLNQNAPQQGVNAYEPADGVLTGAVANDAVEGMRGNVQQPSLARAEDCGATLEPSNRNVASLEGRAREELLSVAVAEDGVALLESRDHVVDSLEERADEHTVLHDAVDVTEPSLAEAEDDDEVPESRDHGVVSLEMGAVGGVAVGHTVPQTGKLCQICANRPYDVVLLPCKHLKVCARCVNICVKCPTCNSKIKGSQKLQL